MTDTGANPIRRPTAGAMASPAGRALRYTALFFAGAVVFHAVDHVRRGLGALTPEVYWGGMALTLTTVVAVVLALSRYRYAATVALVVGLATAILVAAAHLLPPWSALSDAFPGSGVDALSWAAVLAEIAS